MASLLHKLRQRQIDGRRQQLCSDSIVDLLEQALVCDKNWTIGDQGESMYQLEDALSTIAIAISPDCQTFATTHGDHTVKVFKYGVLAPIRVFSGHPRTPWSVKYNPLDSNILASGCLGCEVRIWDIRRAICLNVMRLESSVISLAFHPNGHFLAASSGSKLLFWDWREGMPLAYNGYPVGTSPFRRRRAVVHPRSIRAVLFHPSGDFVFVAAPDLPRMPQFTFTPCRLYVIRFSDIFLLDCDHAVDDAAQPVLELWTAAVVVPEVHLYSDGGLDISKDGKFLITCAIVYVPPPVVNAEQRTVAYNSRGSSTGPRRKSFVCMALGNQVIQQTDTTNSLLAVPASSSVLGISATSSGSSVVLELQQRQRQRQRELFMQQTPNSSAPMLAHMQQQQQQSHRHDSKRLATYDHAQPSLSLFQMREFPVPARTPLASSSSHHSSSCSCSLCPRDRTHGEQQQHHHHHQQQQPETRKVLFFPSFSTVDTTAPTDNGVESDSRSEVSWSMEMEMHPVARSGVNISERPGISCGFAVPFNKRKSSSDDVSAAPDEDIDRRLCDRFAPQYRYNQERDESNNNNDDYDAGQGKEACDSDDPKHPRPLLLDPKRGELIPPGWSPQESLCLFSLTFGPPSSSAAVGSRDGAQCLSPAPALPSPQSLAGVGLGVGSPRDQRRNQDLTGGGVASCRHGVANGTTNSHTSSGSNGMDVDQQQGSVLAFLTPVILLRRALTPSLMTAITSVKFSPTGRFVLLGYGVRNQAGSVEGHPSGDAAAEVVDVSTYDNSSSSCSSQLASNGDGAAMHTVAVICDPVDEVNIALFHPVRGQGILYGTKRGIVRMFQRA